MSIYEVLFKKEYQKKRYLACLKLSLKKYQRKCEMLLVSSLVTKKKWGKM